MVNNNARIDGLQNEIREKQDGVAEWDLASSRHDLGTGARGTSYPEQER